MPPIDPVELAIQLMRIDSTSGRESAVVAWIDHFLAQRGWTTRRITVTDGRDDLFVTSVSEPTLTFSTHLDTVPPFIPPHRDERRLFGRGACDAKGIAAAMVAAAERLRDRGLPVGLLFVVGEEVSHDGAHAASDAVAEGMVPQTSAVLINGEPTESTLAVGTKGAVRVTVRTTGVAAHSAYPQLGRSATTELVRLLADLDSLELPRDPVLGETTINVGSLSGGVADNVLAPAAEARLMIRMVKPLAETQPIIERWADGRATLEWGPMVPPMQLGLVPGFPTSTAAFATDIPVLANWGTPYLFGPGSIHVAHRDDEFVDMAELREAVPAYERLALAALEVAAT